MSTATRTHLARAVLLATAGLLLAACDGSVTVDTDGGGRGELKTLARLECPEREDQLRRVSAAPDGRTCTYEGEGAEVRLQHVALNGRTPGEVLAPFETELRALMPTLTPAAERAPMADIGPGAATVVHSGDEKAHVRVPGLSIDAEGERAQIRIGGALTIDADDTRGVVKVRSEDGDGGVTVDADETGAEIRTRSDEGRDLRSSFILASETPSPTGLRLVGYEARGPRAGPVLVATIRARGEDNDKPMDAMKDMVRKNIGH
jgi:hypothetical protein